MLLTWIALGCTLGGFLVILGHAVAPHTPWFTGLRRRGLEVHLWGLEILGAGTLLSGVVWLLERTPWHELSLSARVVAGMAIVGAVGYLTVAAAALLSDREAWRRTVAPLDLTPRVGEPIPVRFRALLVLGTLNLSVLVVWSL
jgi:hypothetical protein